MVVIGRGCINEETINELTSVQILNEVISVQIQIPKQLDLGAEITTRKPLFWILRKN